MAPPNETPFIRMPSERSGTSSLQFPPAFLSPSLRVSNGDLSPTPFAYRFVCAVEGALIMAAFRDNVGRLKAIARTFDDPAVILSINADGIGLLDLVEELRADVNASGWEGVTTFMNSAQSGHVSNVKYVLVRGGDLMKADDN